MKKIMWAIVLFGIFAAAFYSCTKENNMSDNSVKANNPKMNQEDLRVMNLIVNFKKKVDFYRANPNIKSGESKSVDSTIWYLEAATNYTYADFIYDATTYVEDSVFIEIPLNNGMVLYTDIQHAYDETIESLSNYYSTIEGDEKQLVIVDISLNETVSDKATFKVYSSFGKIDNSSPGDEGWIWGDERGKCDGTQEGKDATNGMEAYLNHQIRLHRPYSSVSFSDIHVTTVVPNDVPCSGAPYDNYKLFQDITPNIDLCMTYEEIDWYKYKLYGIANEFKYSGKEISHALVNEHYIIGVNYITKIHWLAIFAGDMHINNTPPIDL